MVYTRSGLQVDLASLIFTAMWTIHLIKLYIITILFIIPLLAMWPIHYAPILLCILYTMYPIKPYVLYSMPYIAMLPLHHTPIQQYLLYIMPLYRSDPTSSILQIYRGRTGNKIQGMLVLTVLFSPIIRCTIMLCSVNKSSIPFVLSFGEDYINLVLSGTIKKYCQAGVLLILPNFGFPLLPYYSLYYHGIR